MKGDGLRVTARTFIVLAFIASKKRPVRMMEIRDANPHIGNINHFLTRTMDSGYIEAPEWGRYVLTDKGNQVLDEIAYALSWLLKPNKVDEHKKIEERSRAHLSDGKSKTFTGYAESRNCEVIRCEACL